MLTTDLLFFPCLSFCVSLSLKENKFKYEELNENYRYETRLEKEKNNGSLYVFVSKVQWLTRKTTLKPEKRIGDQVKS